MPKEGFTTITVSQDMYERVKRRMDQLNKKAGYKKFRSLAHFVEEAVMQFSATIEE